METLYLDSVDSTHTYLKSHIKTAGYTNPLAVITQHQTNGIGSRDNSWTGVKGNLFFSFVLEKELLPKDLKLQSASIYFSFILKNILNKLGSNIWLKWPNDFYIKDKKIGGTITTLSGDLIYCGIGLNLLRVNDDFGYLDIDIQVDEVLKRYFSTLEEYPLWKHIFSKYEIEFKQKNDFITNIDGKTILLKETLLQGDGSILVNGKKVFSLR